VSAVHGPERSEGPHFSPTFFEEWSQSERRERGDPTPKKVEGVDPLESREPDRGAWIGDGDVDYQYRSIEPEGCLPLRNR